MSFSLAGMLKVQKILPVSVKEDDEMDQKNTNTDKAPDCRRCVYNNFARCGVCFCILPRCRYQVSFHGEKGDSSNGENI